ncbi:GNAT family N-acetyltransferase [Flavilitoribacter nigricans]|uniref:Histone acetyltransferase n=1 Tax=Flavilitoribacter nigricans (strain ATCC 23147 / DSM 23189 / NBRC 102662 / NCIMB 1420 / SS-2) TaxID=1122177 RepID=A0A2D0MZV2_FLAN2|nr:GNAT family N-acetyltransferase [Flavilitoribacter nigricans]PHN01747.1 histone acetyltransferase [Flavilitoribacter nigricans DSM 23189 = NBRC 102662]
MSMDNTTELQIRPLLPEDLPFFREMFYTSLFVAPAEAPFPRSIIDQPHLARYYLDWGGKKDLGWVAEMDHRPVGAVWSRFFPASDAGYGFVEEDAPEIGIALLPAYRGRGIGTALLTKLMSELQKWGVPAVSLSVDKRNRAMQLYRKLGFRTVREDGNAVVMYKPLLRKHSK